MDKFEEIKYNYDRELLVLEEKEDEINSIVKKEIGKIEESAEKSIFYLRQWEVPIDDLHKLDQVVEYEKNEIYDKQKKSLQTLEDKKEMTSLEYLNNIRRLESEQEL